MVNKISKDYLIYILLLFPFLELPILGNTKINYVFIVLKVISTLCSCTLLIKEYFAKNKNCISKELLLIIFLESVFVFSTVINNGKIVESIGDALAIIIPCFLIEYFSKKFDLSSLIKPIVYIFFVYSVLNLFNLFIASGDENYIYLLGIDNRFIFTFLPLCSFSLILYLHNTHKKYLIITVISFIISNFSLLYTWSVSAMVFMLFYTMLVLLLLLKQNWCKIFDYKSFLIFALIFNFLVVGLRIQNYFGDLLFFLFKKNVNLSGRIYLWDFGIQKILSKPIFGYGLCNLIQMNFGGLNHLHNLLLNVTFQSGFVGLILFIFINILPVQNMMKYKENKNVIVISVTIFTMLLLSLFDTLDYSFLFIFYILTNICIVDNNISIYKFKKYIKRKR